MEKDLISVIVPVYKVEKYLDKCVQSIVDQTYENLEIIIIDDSSPDNCPAMCDAWAEKTAVCRFSISKTRALQIREILPFQRRRAITSLLRTVMISLSRICLKSFIVIYLLRVRILPCAAISGRMKAVCRFPIRKIGFAAT